MNPVLFFDRIMNVDPYNIEHHSELQYAYQFADRIQQAAEHLFGDSRIVHRILQACDQYRTNAAILFWGVAFLR